MDWLIRKWQWPYAALFAGLFLLAMAPLWFSFAGLAMALIFLQLPIYMIHQFEEHAHDRFRAFMNRAIGHGREILTPTATFWINALGVWALNLAALYLAWGVELSLGLMAGYLTVVNGLAHLMQGIKLRSYNPGLCTAIVLFLPLGAWCIMEVSRASHAQWQDHALGLGVALAIHAAIIVYVISRMRKFATATSA